MSQELEDLYDDAKYVLGFLFIVGTIMLGVLLGAGYCIYQLYILAVH